MCAEGKRDYATGRMRTAGACALVTGGSSGIGLAIADGLVRLGSDVHIAARHPETLARALAELEAARQQPAQRIAAHRCDVSSVKEVEALFDALRAEQAEPTIVVNSAGVSRPGYFEQLAIEEFDRAIRVNYMGTVHVLKAAVPGMIARGEGHVLNIASVAGLIGVFGMSPYCASKFAVRGLTETLRSELKPHGIWVSLLCPPDTDTPMLAAEAPYKPRETEALSKAAGVMKAAQVAQAALRGLQRHQAVIVPGFNGKLTATAQRLAPALVERLSDRIVRSARRQPR